MLTKYNNFARVLRNRGGAGDKNAGGDESPPAVWDLVILNKRSREQRKSLIMKNIELDPSQDTNIIATSMQAPRRRGFGDIHPWRLYRRLGTLCDPSVPGVTCSDWAARNWHKVKKVFPYKTFEAAAEDVVARKIDVFLVPGAYPNLCYFIQSRELTLVDFFVVRIPSLVVAGTPGTNPSGEYLYYHPATAPYLTELRGHFDLALAVDSNAEACRAVLKKPGNICITNEICAEKFGLQIFIPLWAPLMPFLVFAAAKQKSLISIE